jgi:hypothetical protein
MGATARKREEKEESLREGESLYGGGGVKSVCAAVAAERLGERGEREREIHR